MKKILKLVGMGLGIFIGVVWVLNTSLLVATPSGGTKLIAHRGAAQDFDRTNLTNTTCTAAQMIPTGHSYLENTLASMQAALEYGADIIEFDIHQTTDNQFAVFHDWTLDCRTEASGVTRDHSLAQLQALDIGYGYTADGGQTYPFRGEGVALMPSIDQVFETFPQANLLIDIKSNDPDEGILLAHKLADLSRSHQGKIMVYGGPLPVAEVLKEFPEMLSITRPRLLDCLKKYIALGWSSKVPSSCENSLLLVPANVAPWLWGWPDRFISRMQGVNSTVVIIGDYTGATYTTGFDDPDRLDELGDSFPGLVWTDRIDLIGPALEDFRLQE